MTSKTPPPPGFDRWEDTTRADRLAWLQSRPPSDTRDYWIKVLKRLIREDKRGAS